MDYFKDPNSVAKMLQLIPNFLPRTSSKLPDLEEVCVYVPVESIVSYLQIPSDVDAYLVRIGKNSRGEKYFHFCTPLSIKWKEGQTIGIIYHKWSVLDKLNVARNGAAITPSQAKQIFPLKDLPIQLGTIHTQGNRVFEPISKEEIVKKINKLCDEQPPYKTKTPKRSFTIEGHKCRLKRLDCVPLGGTFEPLGDIYNNRIALYSSELAETFGFSHIDSELFRNIVKHAEQCSPDDGYVYAIIVDGNWLCAESMSPYLGVRPIITNASSNKLESFFSCRMTMVGYDAAASYHHSNNTFRVAEIPVHYCPGSSY